MATQAKGGAIMSADKTVGGRTRESLERWAAAATWPQGGMDYPGAMALIAAAFDSRGLRDGLERAMKIAEAATRVDFLDNATVEQREYAKETLRDLIASLRAALRAEASKLDGEGQPYTLTKAVAEAALDVTRPFREARAAARRPDPPAEERKLLLGHEYRPHNNGHDYCVHRVTDGYVAGSYRDCRQPRSAHE
jgi:hypothetical protein